MDNTIVVTCRKCKHSYEVAPVVSYETGGGVYSSDADFCVKCDSSDLDRKMKDGRPIKE